MSYLNLMVGRFGTKMIYGGSRSARSETSGCFYGNIFYRLDTHKFTELYMNYDCT